MRIKLKYIGKLVKGIFNVSPLFLFILFLNAIVGSIQVYINLSIPRIVIDQLVKTENYNDCIWLILFIVLSNVMLSLIDNIMKYILNTKMPFIREKMKALMAEKIMDLPYYKLEDSKFLDLKERAMYAINEQGALYNIIYHLAALLKNIVMLISVATIVMGVSKVFILFLVIIVIGMFFLYQKYMVYQKEFYDNLSLINRRRNLYDDIAYDKCYSMDFRLSGLKALLSAKYSQFLDKCNHMMEEFNDNKGMYLASFSVIDNIIKFLGYGYIGLRRFTTFFGEVISIGTCVMYVNAIINFSTKISNISENVVQIKQMLKYLEPYIEFMSFKDEKFEGSLKIENTIKEIRFEHVYFKYPGTDKYVLRDINFTIKEGDVVAFVGKNGSGKTTIVKLLCRLYTPEKGIIFLNGKNILEYDIENYIKQLSVVFQDYKIFNYSIEKNITLKDEHDGEITKIIENMKMNKMINSCPNGINSIIGKEYDSNGINLSGGEYQKIAIARAAYKKASLYIMDEPTSALDPIVEAEIFEDMRKITKEKTSIFVSHRMSSCKICDKIFVFDNGVLIERGSHDELIKLQGIYYRLYTTQAKQFKNFEVID